MERLYDELRPSTRILMGPGPSGVHPRVLKAMMTPMLGYLDDEFLAIMAETADLLRRVFGTNNRLTFPVSGTGTAGMEAVLCNAIEPGDRVVVGVNGYFGARIADIARRCGADVAIVEAPWGEIIAPEKFAKALKNGRPKLAAIVHAETSTGVLQPLEDIVRLAHDHGALALVDCVTSLGGQPVDLDRRQIDIAYSATQKCLGGPPGLAPVSFSERACEVIRSRRTPVQSFYLDMSLLDGYWFGETHQYHHTVSMTMIYALRESLRVVLEEGLAARYRRHERNAAALAAGLAGMGLELAAQAGDRAPMMTTVAIPENVDDMAIRRRLLEDYGIEIGGGLGAFKGRAWRIGLMGESARQENVLLFLSALGKLLIDAGYRMEAGTALVAANRIYASP